MRYRGNCVLGCFFFFLPAFVVVSVFSLGVGQLRSMYREPFFFAWFSLCVKHVFGLSQCFRPHRFSLASFSKILLFRLRKAVTCFSFGCNAESGCVNFHALKACALSKEISTGEICSSSISGYSSKSSELSVTEHRPCPPTDISLATRIF